MSKRRGFIIMADLLTMSVCFGMEIYASFKSNWLAVFGFAIAFMLSSAWTSHDSRVVVYPCPSKKKAKSQQLGASS